MSAGPEPPLSCDLRLNHAAFAPDVSLERLAYPQPKSFFTGSASLKTGIA